MRFLKRFWLELVTLIDLELFVWAAVRRFWDAPRREWARYTLDTTIAVSGLLLIVLGLRLTRKWREQTARQVRELSRRWVQTLAQRVLRLVERFQRKYRRRADDLLGGQTRIDLYMPAEPFARRHRRRAWRQLEDEREKLGWLYSNMVETRLRQGEFIRPADTPHMIGARERTTPTQRTLTDIYADYRYDGRREIPQGTADALKRDLQDK